MADNNDDPYGLGTGDGSSSTPAAPAAPSGPDTSGWADQINGYYSTFLGRPAESGAVDNWINGAVGQGKDLGWIQNQIANSAEAQAYAQRAAQPTPPPSPPPAPPPAGAQHPNGYADPAYQNLLDLVNSRLGQLQQPVNIGPLNDYIAQLQANQAKQQQYAQTFAGQLNDRVAQLQQPLLSDANVVQQRALASNATLAQRDQMLANARANLAARGIDPNSSGLAYDQQNQINQNYSNAQANIDAQLQQQNIATDEQRRNEATQLQQLAAHALSGGDLTALQEQAQAAQQAENLFNLNEQRANQALAVGQIPVDLTNTAFQNSLAAANSTQNPLMYLLPLLSAANTQQGIQQNGQNSNMAGLAWLLQQMGL